MNNAYLMALLCRHIKIITTSMEKPLQANLRFRCRHCGSTFSAGLPIRRQRRPELNAEVYKLLINKVPMRRICEVLAINPATLYNKLSYLDHIASEFSERQELKLINSANFAKRAYVSVDRQDHILNWGTQLDRRNIVLGVVGAVENLSGYSLILPRVVRWQYQPICALESCPPT